MIHSQELMRSTHDVVLRLESGGYKVQDMDEAQVPATCLPSPPFLLFSSQHPADKPPVMTGAGPC